MRLDVESSVVGSSTALLAWSAEAQAVLARATGQARLQGAGWWPSGWRRSGVAGRRL